jgi:cytochrome o ubiquinol oxidase subunit 2
MRDTRSIFARRRPLVLVPLLASLGGCARDVLNPAGDIALQQRNLIYDSVALMLLIIIPVLVLIVVFAWRYRSSNRDAVYDPNFDHSTSLELVIWSAPLLIIIALGALTWSNTHLLDPFRPLDRIAPGKPVDPGAKTLRVEVVAMDWKWLFIYPDEGVATVNELVLPINRQVRFDMTSTNMMNTFYAPTLAGMIYTMPGMQSTLHAVLNRPGDYQGLSANYSGAGFSDMRFRLRGVDDKSFSTWLASVRETGKPLQTDTYLELAKPSEKTPVTYFGSVSSDLYRRILNRCVAPGTPCMPAVMAADRAKDARGDHPAAMSSMPHDMPNSLTSSAAPTPPAKLPAPPPVSRLPAQGSVSPVHGKG